MAILFMVALVNVEILLLVLQASKHWDGLLFFFFFLIYIYLHLQFRVEEFLWVSMWK